MSVVLPNLTIIGTSDGQGAPWRRTCRVRTTAVITIGSVNAGDTIDGTVLTTGDRILVANQANTENGIYIVQTAGGLLRAEDLASGSTATGMMVFIREGSTWIDTAWVCTSNPGVVDTDILLFQQTSGTGVDGDVTTTGVQTLTNKTLTAPVIATITNGGTITLPTGTQTLVGRTTTDTLTNKTLTAPVISTIVNTGTLTLPTSTDTLVGRATTDTLTNKTLTAPVISTIVNTGTLTLPTSTDTLVGRATTDTLTNKTLTAPVIATITNGGTITLPTGPQTLVGRTTTDTLTNKTLTAPVIATIVNTGTLTLPTSTDTLVGRATTDTLTNKTLTAPVIATIVNTGTLTLPTSTDTLVGRATTDTLTNKTITDSTNTVTANSLRSIASGAVTVSGTVPTAGQVLTATSTTAASWQTFTGSSIFGTEFQYIEPANFSTTSTSFVLVTGSTISFNSAAAGTYMVNWNYLWYYTATTRSIRTEARINGTSVCSMGEEPSDTSVTQQRSASAVGFIAVPGAGVAISITFFVRTENAADTAGISNLKCYVFRVA